MLDNHQCQVAFGRFIRTGREKKSLQQREVAEMIGISQQYYSKIETANKNVDLTLALKICQALKLDLSDFIRTFL